MWSLDRWLKRRTLAHHPVPPELWSRVRKRLPILDGLSAEEDRYLLDSCVLFLQAKTLTALEGVDLDDESRLFLAAQAQLPLLALGDLNWYQGFHEIVLYPHDFISPQKHRDASGIEHEWNGEHSGEAWTQGPVILAWSGVLMSGGWGAYNLVIHELAHKLDMLNGDANGLPPLHRGMNVSEWAHTMQSAFDALNHQLDIHPHAHTAIDPYAAENPGEFFAVTSEYFFSAPDLLANAYPAVYQQLKAFYRQDTLARLTALEQQNPAYKAHTKV
ncbi:MAG TPA: M90 family metallopeptidase [Pseudomonas sp.]|uniref:M90 family metallopeptidase n=1 Tax=Pseudomonas sp. TaxID=306 RepID=UPI002ED7B2EC